MEIKAGDKVKMKDGDAFSNGYVIATVKRVENTDGTVWLQETNTYISISLIEVIENARPDSEHYHTGWIDVWKFAEANFSYDEVFGFHRIDAIKYLTRFGKKQGRNIRDLEKARAEIDEMIRMEKERAANG